MSAIALGPIVQAATLRVGDYVMQDRLYVVTGVDRSPRGILRLTLTDSDGAMSSSLQSDTRTYRSWP